jgi:hypothetical protein
MGFQQHQDGSSIASNSPVSSGHFQVVFEPNYRTIVIAGSYPANRLIDQCCWPDCELRLIELACVAESAKSFRWRLAKTILSCLAGSRHNRIGWKQSEELGEQLFGHSRYNRRELVLNRCSYCNHNVLVAGELKHSRCIRNQCLHDRESCMTGDKSVSRFCLLLCQHVLKGSFGRSVLGFHFSQFASDHRWFHSCRSREGS